MFYNTLGLSSPSQNRIHTYTVDGYLSSTRTPMFNSIKLYEFNDTCSIVNVK